MYAPKGASLMGEKGGSILATTNNEIIEVLKTIAPGTPIREGLENILKAKTGWTYSYR